MPPLGQVVYIRVSKCSARSSTQNPPENPRGARPRALCVCGSLSRLLGEDRSTRALDTRTVGGKHRHKEQCIVSVYKQGTVHPMARVRASQGVVSRAHRACAPKPTRMAVGLTRDGREALRREVQGISQSSTRRSAYSKRHIGAPNRRTKQVKLLVDHRCSGVTVRKVARYQKPSRTPHTRVTGSRPTCLSVALQLSLGSSAWVTAWAASGCGCTEMCPVTRDLRAVRRRHVPTGRSGRLRGARSLEVSFHRPLVRRAG